MPDPGSTTGSIYIGFQAGSLVESSTILETGANASNTDNSIGIYMAAGAVTVALRGTTLVVVPPRQTKSKVIADNNWHLLTAVFNTDLAVGDQLVMQLDNSTSGVTPVFTGDLVGARLGGDVPNIGARNSGASNFFTGSMRLIYVRNTVDDAAAQTAMFDYWTYLQSISP